MAAPQRLGPYRLERELARGGMGVVHEAVHEPTGARHALKTLLPSGLGGPDSEELARFRREACLLARLDHPHVVRVHAADLEGAVPWLAQDLLPGGSLQARLAERGPLPLDEALGIARALASGLAHAHARGVLHRDLKPHNVLFDAQGAARLVDFGLARGTGSQTRLTATGTILGTPAWMAPEQAQGVPGGGDARSDVYGLGAVLWAMLVGRAPFQGQTAFAILEAVLKGELAPPSRLRRDVPAWLDAVVLRAMARDPAARFASAAELGRALEGPGAAPPARRARWLALPLLAAAAALLVVVLVPAPEVPAPPPPSPPAARDVGPPREELDPSVPAWLGALPAAARPPLPLPAGLCAADEPGRYVNERDGSRLVWVPPATFVMGDESDVNHQPLHEVRITSGVFMGLHEVTLAQMQRFLASGARGADLLWAGARPALPDTPSSVGVDFAAGTMSWSVAEAYCEWVGLRLPTEAEWELAALGTDRRRFPWGDDPLRPGRANLAFTGSPGLLPVGACPDDVSPYGCLDMLGGLEEWVADVYAPYRAGACEDPRGPPAQGRAQRVVRGESCKSDPGVALGRRRRGASAASGSAARGFRVACSP